MLNIITYITIEELINITIFYSAWGIDFSGIICNRWSTLHFENIVLRIFVDKPGFKYAMYSRVFQILNTIQHLVIHPEKNKYLRTSNTQRQFNLRETSSWFLRACFYVTHTSTECEINTLHRHIIWGNQETDVMANNVITKHV